MIVYTTSSNPIEGLFSTYKLSAHPYVFIGANFGPDPLSGSSSHSFYGYDTSGGIIAAPTAFNNSGAIVGTYQPVVYSGISTPFLYNGSLTTLTGFSSPTAINDAGEIAGVSSTIGHAATDLNGTITDLGTLGGTSSQANSISNSGQTAGSANLAGDAHHHAFLDTNGSMLDLGTLGGGNSSASNVNDAGQVVGQSLLADGTTEHAFIYSGGTMQDLNSLFNLPGWVLQNAIAINDQGQIAGNGTFNGVAHAFLLTPLTSQVTDATLSNGVLTVNGTSGDDTITLSQANGDYTATVNNLQPISFETSIVQQIFIYGGDGNDTITVNPDVSMGVELCGGAGNDSLTGGGGSDTLIGNGGDDTLVAGAGACLLIGGGGNDVLHGIANDTLWGGYGNDTIYGGAGANLLTGRSGDDLLYTLAGSTNTVYGGVGNDTLHSLGNDVLPNNDVESVLNS